MNIKNYLMTICLILVLSPLIQADIITPGYAPIEINNRIINLADYPDYSFIVISKGPMGGGFLMPNGEINYVQEDGTIITPYYKFSQISVYAIKNSDLENIDILNISDESLANFFNSEKAIEVITNINHYEERAIADPVRVLNNLYTIDLATIKSKPDNIDVKINFIFYGYILISLICFILIIIILVRRKNK